MSWIASNSAIWVNDSLVTSSFPEWTDSGVADSRIGPGVSIADSHIPTPGARSVRTILAAIFGPEPALFYFIEELENGIHSTRLGLLLCPARDVINSLGRRQLGGGCGYSLAVQTSLSNNRWIGTWHPKPLHLTQVGIKPMNRDEVLRAVSRSTPMSASASRAFGVTASGSL